MLLHRKASSQGSFKKSFYTEELLHRGALKKETCTQRSFYTQLHTEAFTQRSLYRGVFIHKSLDTEELLHTDAFTHRSSSVYTEKSVQRSFFTQTLFHREELVLVHSRFFTHTHKLLHKCFLHTDMFRHKSLYTEELLHTEVCTEELYAQKLVHRGVTHLLRNILSNS